MYISTKSLTAAAALSAGVAADFLVITEYPDALQTMSPEQAQSWISANLPSIRSEYLQMAVTDTSYIAAATSVIPELNQFVATASISIPPVVTALDDFEIYTTVPPWYTQLPSGVRSFYDDTAQRVESILEKNVTGNATASSTMTSESASTRETPTTTTRVITSVGGPTPSGPGEPPEETGRARKVEVGVGMGVVAGVVGVLML